MVLLAVANGSPECYVTTANIDGEANLKVRTPPEPSHRLTDPATLARALVEIKCGGPDPDITKFSGMLNVDVPPSLHTDARSSSSIAPHSHGSQTGSEAVAGIGDPPSRSAIGAGQLLLKVVSSKAWRR